MVGASVALGLSDLGFNVAMIEAIKPNEFDPKHLPDLRVSAINASSESLLNKLGAWDHLKAMRTCAYRRLSVWEQVNYRTDFHCDSVGASHLGHIVENRIVQLALHQAVNDKKKITSFIGDKIKHIELVGDFPVVRLANNVQIRCKVLVGADGANSMVRHCANIGTTGWQYKQQVFAININTNRPQQDITWQQFTPSGPLAFLPLYDGYASLIWYNQPKKIDQLVGLSWAELKQEIIQEFPDDLGDFDILDTARFPLTRMHANQYTKSRVALLGDAAHTINPLAGQGVNLGFKDVAAFIDALQQEIELHGIDQSLRDGNLARWLSNYEKSRRGANLSMMSAMDCLYAAFSNEHLGFKLMRNIGLRVANRMGPIKAQALKYATGLG